MAEFTHNPFFVSLASCFHPSAPYLPAHTSAPIPALLDEFLIQIQTVWQTDILHGTRVHIAAVDHAKALRLPLNLHHGAVETGLRFTLIGGSTDNTCDVGECRVLGELSALELCGCGGRI